MDKSESSFGLQLDGYRLATAEILYHLPDHPGIIQSFIWQQFDRPPTYPRLRHFIDYWQDNIEARLHKVYVGSAEIILPSTNFASAREWTLQ